MIDGWHCQAQLGSAVSWTTTSLSQAHDPATLDRATRPCAHWRTFCRIRSRGAVIQDPAFPPRRARDRARYVTIHLELLRRQDHDVARQAQAAKRSIHREYKISPVAVYLTTVRDQGCGQGV